MAMNPTHRYAIMDASRGSRLIETCNSEARALDRADYLTRARIAPIEVKDRHEKDRFGKSVSIYRTTFETDGLRKSA